MFLSALSSVTMESLLNSVVLTLELLLQLPSSGNVRERKRYPMTIITCSVSTLSLALTLISFMVPPAGA